MTTEVLAATLTAGAQSTFGQGRVWYIKAATSAMTIIAEKLGTGAIVRRFINVAAGFKFKAREGEVGWDYLRVTSALAQNIEIVIGDDDIEVANAVTVTGSVVTVVAPSNTVTDTADTAQAAGTQTAIGANLARRRITIGVPSNALNSVRVSKSGGAARGIEIQPGNYLEFTTTDSLVVRNDDTAGTAAGTSWYAEEET